MKGREREKGRYTLYIYTRAHKEAQKGKGKGRLEQIQSIRIQKKEKDLLKTGEFVFMPLPSPGCHLLHHTRKRHHGTPIYRCLPY